MRWPLYSNNKKRVWFEKYTVYIKAHDQEYTSVDNLFLFLWLAVLAAQERGFRSFFQSRWLAYVDLISGILERAAAVLNIILLLPLDRCPKYDCELWSPYADVGGGRCLNFS